MGSKGSTNKVRRNIIMKRRGVLKRYVAPSKIAPLNLYNLLHQTFLHIKPPLCFYRQNGGFLDDAC